MGSHTVIKKLGTRRYRRLSSNLDDALRRRDFDRAARYGASISAVASSNDVVGILLSAVEAYKTGKAKDWVPPSSEIAKTGVKRAKDVDKVTLASGRQATITSAISEAAERAKKRRS